MLKFITSNKLKFDEVQKALGELQITQVNIDLLEIQELNSRKIIMHKLREAEKKVTGEFIVEDSHLYLSCLGDKLPGPFIKWFGESMSVKDLYNLCKKMGNNKAVAKCFIGYSNGKIFKIFESSVQGTIVAPKGKNDFGYGPIFIPKGSKLTYGEMSRESKNKFSSRALAALKLKKHLLK